MTKNRKEIILYLIFGALTTLVNLVIFIAFGAILGDELYLVSNLIAWVGAVIFAFVVNKLFVFESHNASRGKLARELLEFVGARVFSFGFEEVGFFLLVDVLTLGKLSFTLIGFKITGQLISKVILAVVVVILNYFFSKYIIFKKDTKSSDSDSK